ncbi:chemotaxis protein MotB [Halomonas ventosae]|uniref:Chemotaxis protein MotB n=1 Tax=Halomonas ventosae TaxID=229007 RepID=A0A4R6ZTM6_9GAMM|nr:flagellar motor protein MotB [Halomonas ventosae]TDR56143.1 chemotaxis protein MotB [Halomonas ventosae]
MSKQRPIIIRRKKVIHKHHGGAWKIALADFMTALMALFLVLWIVGTASNEQRESIAEYFRTPLSAAITGDGASSEKVIPGGGPDPTHAEGERARIDLKRQTRPSEERRRLRRLQRRIETAIQGDSSLRELRQQLLIDETREGLRIQLVDSERRPMFELGSDRVAPYMRELLHTLAPLLNELDNRISISGHTDSLPYVNGQRGYGNWELSSNRANASRRELVSGGLDPGKLLRVSGMGDQLPLPDAPPDDPMNRRITLLVLDTEARNRIQRQGELWQLAERAPLPVTD